MKPEDLQNLAQIMVELQKPGAESQNAAVQAVALKLPAFWRNDPEVWFQQIESQFNLRKITEDRTMFDYVVGSLDNQTAAEVRTIIMDPPNGGKFEAIKQALIEAFGVTQAKKDALLLTLPDGLGDRDPTSFLRYIRGLNSNQETLLRAIFMSHLPTSVRQVLATSNKDLEAMAQDAKKIMEAGQSPAAFQVASAHHKPTASGGGNNDLCYFHYRFGEDSRSCKRGGCKMQHKVPKKSENGQAGR